MYRSSLEGLRYKELNFDVLTLEQAFDYAEEDEDGDSPVLMVSAFTPVAFDLNGVDRLLSRLQRYRELLANGNLPFRLNEEE